MCLSVANGNERRDVDTYVTALNVNINGYSTGQTNKDRQIITSERPNDECRTESQPTNFINSSNNSSVLRIFAYIGVVK